MPFHLAYGELQIHLLRWTLLASTVTVGVSRRSRCVKIEKSVGVMFPLPFRRLPAPIAMLSSVRDFRETPFVTFRCSVTAFSVSDLPEYFQRLSFGWRGDRRLSFWSFISSLRLRFPWAER